MKLSTVVLEGTFQEDYFDDNGTNYGLAFDDEGGMCDYTIMLCSSIRKEMKPISNVFRRIDHGIYPYEGKRCRVVIEESAVADTPLVVGHWVRLRTYDGSFPDKRSVRVTAVGTHKFLGRFEGSSGGEEQDFNINPTIGTWISSDKPGQDGSGFDW